MKDIKNKKTENTHINLNKNQIYNKPQFTIYISQ
jgi:hypothetical protein